MAILRLSAEGHGIRAIARLLKLSRNAVRKVLDSGVAEVPTLERDEKLAVHLERVRELFVHCKGNLVRVHEELAAEGIEVGYSSLTAFCRHYEIGQPPKQRVGQYHFEPGEEMRRCASTFTTSSALTEWSCAGSRATSFDSPPTMTMTT